MCSMTDSCHHIGLCSISYVNQLVTHSQKHNSNFRILETHWILIIIFYFREKKKNKRGKKHFISTLVRVNSCNSTSRNYNVTMSDVGEFKAMSLTLMIVLSIWATLLNSLCIIIIGRSRALIKRPSALLILNLLIVHWVQGTVVFPFYTAKKAKVISLYWAGIICDGFRFTYMVTFYAAIMAVFLISLDRLLATCLVLRYKELVTRKKVIAVASFTWCYVIVLCLLPFKSEEAELANTPLLGDNGTLTMTMVNDSKISSQKPKICSYSQSSLWTILMLTLNCAVPYVAITVIYQRIMSHVNVIQSRTERSRTITSAPINTPPLKGERFSKFKDKERQQYVTITRIAIIMCISYFFFWLPSVIYFITLKLCPNRCFPTGYHESVAEKYVSFFTKYLAYLDAVASPIIYCVMSGEFRKHVTCSTEERATLVVSRTQQQSFKSRHDNHKV